jgi:hypothetical protein
MLLKAAPNQQLVQVIDNTRENNLGFGPRLAGGASVTCEHVECHRGKRCVACNLQTIASQRNAREPVRVGINSFESIGAISRSLIVLLQVIDSPALTEFHIM